MTQRLLQIVLLLAALVLPQAAAAAAPPIPAGTPFTFYDKIVGSQAATALLRSDYAALEDMARGFRDSKSRTPIGSADLLVFYRAFDFTTTGDPSEDERQLDRLERKVLDWARAYPNSPAPHIVYAILLTAHGCAICSRGYTPERWKAYQSYLRQARSYLLAHKAVASNDPEWYVEMLVLADDLRETTWRPLLAEATRRYPDYYAIYNVATVLYADSGSADGLDDLIDGAIARTHVSDGMELYARLYGHVGFNRFDGGKQLFTRTHATWARMLGSYIELTNKYPDPYLFEEMFFYACVAGDKVSARLALPHLLPLRRTDMWQEPADFAACTAWAQGTSNAPSPLAADPSPPAGRPEVTQEQAVYLMIAAAAVMFLILARAVA